MLLGYMRYISVQSIKKKGRTKYPISFVALKIIEK
jgi:hypothetical protein